MANESHTPWSQEEAEKAADNLGLEDYRGSDAGMDSSHMERSCFLAGVAWAAAQIEKCPTMYGSHVGDPINRYWESTRASCDTHEAKLVGVREVEK